MKHRFGLIGKNISYSFSKTYFSDKFDNEGLSDYVYDNFDLSDISDFPRILLDNKDIKGLNVTIPYKEDIMPYLDKVTKKARKIGAVNTIKITKRHKLIGYNTDCYGFEKSIKPHLKPHHKKALILGTGGASKAIKYVFDKLDFEVKYVSRNPSSGQLGYSSLSKKIMDSFHIIVNCTPLGTFPNTSSCPDIPYAMLTDQHLLYDLTYNPSETEFLKRGKNHGAMTLNGLRMLHLQAEKAWKIWN